MPNGLFKYFPRDGDKLEWLANCQVLLTPPEFFNDPWDFLVRCEPYTEQTLPPGFGFMKVDAASDDFLMSESSDLQAGLSAQIGVISLTEKPLDRLMWAHYGESHRGFVAEFRHTDEETSASGFRLCDNPFGTAVKVNYQRTQPVLKRNRSNIDEVVLTKNLDWEYEQEWRVIQAKNKATTGRTRAGEPRSLLKFDPSHLVRVIFGLRICPKVEAKLREMLGRTEFRSVRKEKADIDPDTRELISRELPG
jgi:hypothetical protein